MKTQVVIGLAAALAAASIASAGIEFPHVPSSAMYAQDLITGDFVHGEGLDLSEFGKQTYDSGIGNDQVPSGPIVGSLSGAAIMDDFTKKTNDFAGANLSLFQFMGGGVEGGLIQVVFYDSEQSIVDGFTATLPVTGEYIWSLDVRGLGIGKTHSGFVQIQYEGKGEFTWLWTDAMNIGFNEHNPDFQDGSVNTTMYAFSMWNMPAPGALALLGLAGLVGTGRRRTT